MKHKVRTVAEHSANAKRVIKAAGYADGGGMGEDSGWMKQPLTDIKEINRDASGRAKVTRPNGDTEEYSDFRSALRGPGKNELPREMTKDSDGKRHTRYAAGGGLKGGK